MICSKFLVPSESTNKVGLSKPYSINLSKFCLANCFKGLIMINWSDNLIDVIKVIKVLPVPQGKDKIPRLLFLQRGLF